MGSSSKLDLNKGDIVLYPFPYTNLSSQKIRPCLVLSNQMREDILLCQITSQYILDDEFCIKLSQNETIHRTLSIDSLIRTNMLFTAHSEDIIKKICEISDNKYKEVYRKIKTLIKR